MERNSLLFLGVKREVDKIEYLNECKPALYGAIVLYFPLVDSTEFLQAELSKYSDIRIYEECIEVTYKEIKNLHAWDIDQLLTLLFAKCSFEEIINLIKKHQGKVLIDISFYHKEKYPALLFSGKNMNIIHALHADISIDPY